MKCPNCNHKLDSFERVTKFQLDLFPVFCIVSIICLTIIVCFGSCNKGSSNNERGYGVSEKEASGKTQEESP